MASLDLNLSANILAFLSKHKNHIKDNKTATCHSVFPFDRLLNPLKEIPNISTMPLVETHLTLPMQNNLRQSSSVGGQ